MSVSQNNNGNQRKTLTSAFVGIWALFIVVFMSLLMGGHTVPLPAAGNQPTLVNFKSATFSDQNAALAPAATNAGWKIIHVLVAGCSCSSYTAASLAARKPIVAEPEFVFVLGGAAPWEFSLRQSGFIVEEKDAEQLAKDTGIQGGPWLLLISPAGKIVYSGGYAAERPRPGVALNDLAVITAAFHGEPMPAYPAYGCAATRVLQGQLDPLGICRIIK